MTGCFRRVQLFLSVWAWLIVTAAVAHAAPVLMISIDGLKPEYVTHAAENGVHVPTLSGFMKDGTYADGVIPVLPSVTYPDHTTLVTGVWPRVHGIVNNTVFDPERAFGGAWYWYAGDIRVPTLWEVAHQAGIRTASVSWPVTVNATAIDTLIPEYWRGAGATGDGNAQDREMMAAISRPDGTLAAMEKRLGPYMMGNDTTLAGDRTRTRFSLDILERQRPGFMTIHLSSLDEAEHLHGPFSPQADQTLEAIDGMVAQLMAAALRNDPQTDVLVVSDHGFARVDHALNLTIPFLQAGLIEVKQEASGRLKVRSWRATPWSAGGMAAIMLHDPADKATRRQVQALLAKLAADPANGIARVLDGAEARTLGGFPDAAFVVAMKPGYMIGGATSGPLIEDNPEEKGTHGFLPTFPEMHASFFVRGKGIAHGRDLGTIDMRRIAPTVAALLDVKLATATEAPLLIRP